MTPHPYRIKLHKKVLEEDSQYFTLKAKEKIKKKCLELLSFDPEKVGDPLRRELSAYRRLRVLGDYRVVFRVDRKLRVVFILAIGIRRNEEVYKEAIKRI